MSSCYEYLLAHSPIEYEYYLNRYTWLRDGTQTGTTTLGQSGHESNCNEGEIDTTQIVIMRCSLVSYFFWKGFFYTTAGKQMAYF